METIVDHLARQAETHADLPFLSEGGETLTFAAFHARVRRLAGFLAEAGVRAGDRVVLYLDRRVPHLLGYFASMALGAIPVHLYAQRKPGFVGFAAAHTGAALVLTDSAALDPAGLSCRAVRFPAPDAALPERWSGLRDPVAYMMFTSGTTGEPKAVMTTQANVLFVTRTLIGIPGMRHGDKEVIVMPLGSTGGLGHVHASLLLGNHAILLPYFFGAMTDDDLRDMLAVIAAEGVTGFLSTPGMLGRLAGHHREAFRRQARGVRYILANVTPIRPELVRDLLALLPGTRFHTYYGLTEASRCVYHCYNDHPDRLRAAGRPAPGMEVRIAAADPVTGIGEVVVRGGNVMAGYWQRPGDGFDAEGWFHTGDLGTFDAAGFLTIRGRLKDSIKVDGLECFPHEVEAVLERHPAVEDCAVVAVPDRMTWQRIGAAVVPRAGADPTGLAEALTALCRGALERYKVPAQFLFLDALPRAELGKVDRQALRDLLVRAGEPLAGQGAEAGAPAAPGAPPPLSAEAAHRRFRERYTAERRARYHAILDAAIGTRYPFSATPFFLERDRYAELAATTEAVVRLLRSPAYQAEVAATPWFLPQQPIDARDCLGSVDFHVGPDGAKVIEVNFFPPGFVGLLELLESALFEAFDLAEYTRVNAGFEADMVAVVTEGGRHRRLALAVNHTPISAYFVPHYRYAERIFRRHGIDCRMVYARDVTLDADGYPCWDGERYEAVFSLVIPRIMEYEPDPFARFIELFHRRPEVVYPRPLGWKLGMKRMLADLHRLDPAAYGLGRDDAERIAAAALPARGLAEFADADAVLAAFGGSDRLVLKPLDNYDMQGVLLRPSREQVERAFAEAPHGYIVQEWFPPPEISFITMRGAVEPHEFSLRMGFLAGRCRGVRGAAFPKIARFDRQGRRLDCTAPVVIV